MTRDELEFSISQYLDGTLAEPQRSALDERLSRDAEARALLAEYQRLDVALKAAAPLPQVRWDRLAESISAAVAQQEAPVQSFLITRWLRAPARLAIAASALLAVGIAAVIAMRHSGNVNTGGEPPRVVAIRAVDVEHESPLRIVAVDPSLPADRPAITMYADDVISRPSRVVIASGVRTAQDSPAGFPY